MKFSGNAVALLASTGVANAALYPRYTSKALVPISILMGSVTSIPTLGMKPDVEDGTFEESQLRSGAVTSKVGSLFGTSLAPHSRHLGSLDGFWTQLGLDIDGEASFDESGYSVSLSSDGTTVAIGATKNDGDGLSNSGHVRVYKYDANAADANKWTQLGPDIDGEAADDQSGYSVSLSSDGTTVAIGARYNDGDGLNNSGHVRVYKYDANADDANKWTQVGPDIDGEAVGDNSGWSVSLSSDGKTVAIGAMYNDGNGLNAGHVGIFTCEEAPEPSSAPTTSPEPSHAPTTGPKTSRAPTTGPETSRAPTTGPEPSSASAPSSSVLLTMSLAFGTFGFGLIIM